MIRVSLSVAAVALVALSLPPSLLAQQEPVVEPDAKVRVTAPSISSDRLVGTLLEVSADSYVLEAEGWDSPLAVPFASVTSLEVSQGEKGWGWKKGALVGFLGGTASWWVVASALEDQDRPPSFEESVVALVSLGGVAVGGSIVGGLLARKREDWEEVSRDRLRLLIVPQADGRIRIGGTIRFR